MGVELLMLSYLVGLIPIAYGLSIAITGRITLTPWSRGPTRGLKAWLLGCVCMIAAIAYYTTIDWAWSLYDR